MSRRTAIENSPGYGTVPVHPAAQYLGRPPGFIADIGGSLIHHAPDLQRQGWNVHTVCFDDLTVKQAARIGIRTVLLGKVDDIPLGSGWYDAAVLAGDYPATEALHEMIRICRPGARAIVTAADPTTQTLRQELLDGQIENTTVETEDGAHLVLRIKDDATPLALTPAGATG